MPSQEIIPPDRDASVNSSRREIELIDHSVSDLRSKMNFVDRIRANLASGRATADMIVAMQGDVLRAQRDIIQHHALMIARERKMQITDAYQAGIGELTRRVEDRVAEETKYYWTKVYDRLDYYENFFESKIRDLRAKAKSGEMTEARSEARIKQIELDRDNQMSHDNVLLEELREANARVLKKALEDYRPA